MNKTRRLIAKLIALLYGLLGLSWLVMGFGFIAKAVADKDLMMVVVIFSFIAFGAVLAAIGYQIVFRYTEPAVKNLCGLIGLTAFSLAARVLRPAANMTLEGKEMSAHTAVMIIPIILGVVAYKIAMGVFGSEKK